MHGLFLEREKRKAKTGHVHQTLGGANFLRH